MRPAAHSAWRRHGERWFQAKPDERIAVVSAGLLFFLLFTSYMMLRPVRETMGIAGGVDNLQWLFLATFLATIAFVPLFGLITRFVPRKRLLAASYKFSATTLLALALLMHLNPGALWVGRLFYVWLSVLNLFLISVAWSVMSDVFRTEQARRLFGQIAAGASLGGLAGPLASGSLVALIGHSGLLLVSAVLLLATLPLARHLFRWRAMQPDAATDDKAARPIGGSIIGGLGLLASSTYLLGIALFVVLLTSVSTFLYFEQAEMVQAMFPDPIRQTQLFSAIDAVVQALTIGVQLFLTGRIASRLGVTILLTAIPVAMIFGFGLLAVAATFPVLLVVVVLRRVGEYALARPGREMLFTNVGQAERYKGKNVIDTVVYRGGDAASAGLRTLIETVGASPILFGGGLAGLWAISGFVLGRNFDRRATAAARIQAAGVPT